MNREVMIAGAGPAGMAAALAVAQRGARARLCERRSEVGARFHGDFQGLENWTTEADVLEELARLGIEPGFDHAAFRECVLFDPEGREYACRSREPLWYLVRRGTDGGTLDQALKRQVLAAGVELELGTSAEHLPEGGVVAHGPKRPDVIAVGYVGRTEMADGAFGVVSDALAPRAYAYLLVSRGRATMATCLFDDFHNERLYLERTAEFFRERAGMRLRDEQRFGGFGTVSARPILRRGRLLFAGEAAGLQDALLGFGMRYALVSGHLAGVASADGSPAAYERAHGRALAPLGRAGIVNRFLYHHAGGRGHRRLLERLTRSPDPRGWLRRYYGSRWWARLLFPLARSWARGREDRNLAAACREDCDCTWCRCVGHGGPR